MIVKYHVRFRISIDRHINASVIMAPTAGKYAKPENLCYIEFFLIAKIIAKFACILEVETAKSAFASESVARC